LSAAALRRGKPARRALRPHRMRRRRGVVLHHFPPGLRGIRAAL
jgi:hypothetical protein